MKHGLVTLVVVMILKDRNFTIIIVSSLFCVWNITTVEINSGVHLFKIVIRQVLLFTSGSLGLGLGRGLKSLVLFTSLLITDEASCSVSRNEVSPGNTASGVEGSEGPWFNSNLGHSLSLPSLPFPSLFPSSSPAQLLPCREATGSGERYKLPQRGLGRSPSRNRIWCILALKSVIW